MILSLGTIAKGAALLHQEGAREVYACTTHAVFRYNGCYIIIIQLFLLVVYSKTLLWWYFVVNLLLGPIITDSSWCLDLSYLFIILAYISWHKLFWYRTQVLCFLFTLFLSFLVSTYLTPNKDFVFMKIDKISNVCSLIFQWHWWIY